MMHHILTYALNFGRHAPCHNIDHILLDCTHVSQVELLISSDPLSQNLIYPNHARSRINGGPVVKLGVIGRLATICCDEVAFLRIQAPRQVSESDHPPRPIESRRGPIKHSITHKRCLKSLFALRN